MAETREESSNKTVGDDEDIPGLEDVTALLDQAQQLRKQFNVDPNSASSPDVQNGQDAIKKVTSTAEKSRDQSKTTSSTSKPETKKPAQAKKTETFGGMRKGFLFGGKPAKPTATKSSSKPAVSSADALPLIKPKDPSPAASKLEIPEVQEAMKAGQGPMASKEWITDELLEKVRNRPHLLSKMSNPEFMKAIAEYQADPKQAMAKYQSNPEIQQFIREFFGILGEHFETLPVKGVTTQEDVGKTLGPAPGHELKQDEQDHIDRVLADPDMKDVLLDPEVLKLMNLLHKNPEDAHSMLAQADPALKNKVGKLMGAGLLQMQR